MKRWAYLAGFAPSDKNLQDTLNRYGEQGWELCYVERVDTHTGVKIYVVFKRSSGPLEPSSNRL